MVRSKNSLSNYKDRALYLKIPTMRQISQNLLDLSDTAESLAYFSK